MSRSRDLPIAHAAGRELEHLSLAAAQRLQRRLALATRTETDLPAGRHHRPTIEDMAEGQDQLRDGVGLQHHPLNPLLDRTANDDAA